MTSVFPSPSPPPADWEPLRAGLRLGCLWYPPSHRGEHQVHGQPHGRLLPHPLHDPKEGRRVPTRKLEEGLALRALLPAELVGGRAGELCWLRPGRAVPEGWGADPSQFPAGEGRSPRPPPAHLRQQGPPQPQKQADSQSVCSHSPA